MEEKIKMDNKSIEEIKKEVNGLIRNGEVEKAIKLLKSMLANDEISNKEWLETVEFAVSLRPKLLK